MYNAIQVRRFSAVGVVVIVFLLFMALIPGALPFIPTAKAAPKACPTQFYAYKAPAGSHQFGPDQDALITEAATSLKGAEPDVHKTFDKVRGCDPLIAAAVHEFVLRGRNIDPTATRNLALAYQQDRKAWSKDNTWVNNQVASYSVDFSNQKYATLAMRPGSDSSVMPTLFKVDRSVSVEYNFTLHLKNGTIRKFRLICLFQPVEEKFPHMPPIPTTGCTSNCSPPPVCRSHCSPPPVCTTKCVTPKCPGTNNPVPPNGLCAKDPNADPQSQGNVPTQVTKNHPSTDNGTEISNGPTKPVDSGNGIPAGSQPRVTPSPAPTHTGTATPPPPSSSPSPAPSEVQATPTSNGGVPTHCPGC
jgi:hypothetical protein